MKGCTVSLVGLMVVHICLAAVSDTACDPSNDDDTSGGAAVCEGVNANAECPDGTTKCACKSGYKQDPAAANTCVTAISETGCDPDNADPSSGGAAVCKGVDDNAVCPAGKDKCACKSGYKQHAVVNSCVKAAVSETACTPSSNDATTGGAAVCKTVDTNAECVSSTTKCACKSGYKEGSPDKSTCVPKPVSETTCNPSSNDATTGESAVCKKVDSNAECLTGATECACKSGYKEGSPNSNTCVLKSISETDCNPAEDDDKTGGAAVCHAVDANAECPTGTTKCACKSGYKQDTTNVNTCVTVPDSSATSAWMTTSLIGTSLLTLVLRLIF
ncbi:cell death abnormality protein 1-like isoform X2 [Mercenaria mercenaria]|nr:cell death abnormality protein 1-like isoform X2 [Mercenaria mercenaria]